MSLPAQPSAPDLEALIVFVDGKRRVVGVAEMDPYLDDDIDPTTLAPLDDEFIQQVQEAVEHLKGPGGDGDDEDHEDDTAAKSKSVDAELELDAAVLTAERFIVEQKYDEIHALVEQTKGADPEVMKRFLQIGEELERAQAASAGALAKVFARGILRERRRRFGTIIETRRKELRMSREQLAAACGLSASTIKNLETSDDPDRVWNQKTREAIESAFEWTPGTFERVLAGGDPEPLPRRPADASEVRVTYERLASTRPIRLEAKVYEALEALAVAEDRNINDIVEEALDLYWRLKAPRDAVSPFA